MALNRYYERVRNVTFGCWQLLRLTASTSFLVLYFQKLSCPCLILVGSSNHWALREADLILCALVIRQLHSALPALLNLLRSFPDLPECLTVGIVSSSYCLKHLWYHLLQYLIQLFLTISSGNHKVLSYPFMCPYGCISHHMWHSPQPVEWQTSCVCLVEFQIHQRV